MQAFCGLENESSNTSRRKAREAYLINRGQTLELSGMNRRNERWLFNFITLFKTDLFFYFDLLYFLKLEVLYLQL